MDIKGSSFSWFTLQNASKACHLVQILKLINQQSMAWNIIQPKWIMGSENMIGPIRASMYNRYKAKPWQRRALVPSLVSLRSQEKL